ncbi:DUF1838 family protein [Nonomuraea sp. NPDC050310]|uniref:DUF1838 family protein n=1 Tax=unclassified Nonomuraea TaxID=2593643 RepID=UPI00340BB336
MTDDSPENPTAPGPLYEQVTDVKARAFLQAMGRPDGQDMVYRISGSVYAHVPADALAPALRHGQKLFGLEGYNVRRLFREPGTDRLHVLTREFACYTDPADPARVLREWANPLDGRIYPVVPINNDAVNLGPFPVGPGFRGFPCREIHGEWVWSMDIPPRTDLLGTVGDDFGLAGGIYTTMEMFDFYVSAEEARQRAEGLPYGAMRVKNSWTRSGPWAPFMGLRERETEGGHLVYHARSWSLDSVEEVEPWLREEAGPLYLSSPEAPGPNQTSWTSFWAKQLGAGELTWAKWCEENGRPQPGQETSS